MGGGFIYGPVASRRLGRSLGVDLVPYKTCTYDCVYCQLGHTESRTMERREYAPSALLLDELEDRLPPAGEVDFVSLAGSGEPTLHDGLGTIIEQIKRRTSIPVAVLTNGSLLWMPEVRAALAEADLLLPSLDAGSPASFQAVNQPHPDISFEAMVEGLIDTRESFGGEMRLEVFVLEGMNDSPEEIERIAESALRIRPDRVQLNTISRPPADGGAHPASAATMQRAQAAFGLPCEIIAERRAAPHPRAGTVRQESVEALVGRRPCTLEGIASGLGSAPNEVIKVLDVLEAAGAVRAVRRGDLVFYEKTRG